MKISILTSSLKTVLFRCFIWVGNTLFQFSGNLTDHGLKATATMLDFARNASNNYRIDRMALIVFEFHIVCVRDDFNIEFHLYDVISIETQHSKIFAFR